MSWRQCLTLGKRSSGSVRGRACFSSIATRSCEKKFDFRGLGAVLCDASLKDVQILKRAHAQSSFLDLPLLHGSIEDINKAELYERLVTEQLQFLLCVRFDRMFVSYLSYITAPNGKVNVHASSAIGCDFAGDRMTLKRLYGHFDQSAPLMRAVRDRSFVLDGTGGMGQDALMMAHNGCEVLMVENNPVLYTLLKDSLERSSKLPDIGEITARMSVVFADTVEFLQTWKPPTDVPLTIYLDPFYPELHGTQRQRLKYTRTNQDIAFALRCSDWMDEREALSRLPPRQTSSSYPSVLTARFQWSEDDINPLSPSVSTSSSTSAEASLSSPNVTSFAPPPCDARELEPSPRCSGLGCMLMAAYGHQRDQFRVVIKRPKNAPVLPAPRSWSSHSYSSRATRYDVQSPPKLKV